MTDATPDRAPDSPTDTVPERNWAPTRTSTAIAGLGTVCGVALLSRLAGVGAGVPVAGAGAVGLAAALWLLDLDSWRVSGTLAASLLVVPAVGAVAAGIGYELLVEFAAVFPAPNPTRVAGQSLRLLGIAAVLCGCTLAVFGAAASVRRVATGETLGRCWGLVVRTAVVPVAVAVGLAATALATEYDLVAVDRIVDRVATGASGWLFAPAASDPEIGSFAAVVAAAAFATYRALRALPIRELAGGATVGDLEVAAVADALDRAAVWVATAALAALPIALLVGVAVPTDALRAALPPAAFDPLVDVTTDTGLRRALVGLTVGALAVAVAVALVRGSARTPTADLLVGYAPHAAGVAIAAASWVAGERVVDGLVAFVAGRLDAALADQFRRLSGGVVDFYGAETVVVGLAALVAFLAALGVFALWFCFAIGLVADAVAGPSLAAGGLFVAAAFAGTLDVPLWTVLAGLALALVIWDAGEFATTLGAEVGRRADTRRAELLHAVGTVAVGGLALAAADGVADAIPSAAPTAVGGVTVALVGAVGAIVLLVAALR
ncbi:DUF7519 family protein [Halorussus marinus]|uniref:DUF7519 family protein n=1 Tax=Halorussus marinus TaxID=2505976 RepID=UPI00106E5600|nr:hypothetical protein [Halorussus marinus]